MTATRIGLAATISVAWAAAAVLLWRAVELPPGDVPSVEARSLFAPDVLERNGDYQHFFRALWALTLAAQLAALALLARARPFGRLPALPRAAALGGAAFAAAWLAALPFLLAGQWWRRRHGVSRQGYADWLAGTWSTTLAELVLACVAALVLVALARRLRRWWLAAWVALVALAAAWVLAYPYALAPRLRPLDDPALTAQLHALGADEVVVRKARERTRALNAEAIGIGPTTRVILWDTLLAAPREEILFLAAHEVAHVERRHAWKGVGWFALLALPGALVLSRVRLSDPASVPRAALVALLLSVLALPAASAITRRYEREADWLALRATGDAAAAEGLLRRFARVNLSDPDPPRAWHLLAGTHPTLPERIALARSTSPAGRGSP